MNEQLALIYSYLHGMWRFRWSAIFISWVVVITGWTVVFSLPDKFNVMSVVYVDTSSVMKPLLKGLAPEMDTRDELAVMSRVLLSRENLLSVMRETDMDLEVRNNKDREKLLDNLRGSIEVKGGRGKRNIYELSYTGKSGKRAYQIVSLLLNTMIEDTLKSTRTDTGTAEKFLDSQIKEYEKRLSGAEQQLAEFKKENVGYMPDEKGSFYARLQRAQDSVETSRSQLKLAQQRYAELQKQLSGEAPLIDSQTYMSGTSGKLRNYEEQLQQLLNSYTDRHPDVLALKATIENLKASDNTVVDGNAGFAGDSDTAEFNPVYQEMKVEANKAGVDVGILKVQIKEQEKSVEKLKGSIDIIPEVEAKLTQLNRDYEITRGRYFDLVERRESARLAQSVGQSTSSDIKFRVIDPPVIPVRPSGPPRLLFLAAVLVIGLGSGLAWSFLRFMLEPGFFDLRQVTEKTGLPILGTVSLYLSPQLRIGRKLQLASFLSVTSLLVVVFVGTVIFNKEGIVFVGDKLSSFKQMLKEER